MSAGESSLQNPFGRVVSVHSGSDGSQALVEVVAGVICERCASGKGCGAGLLGGAQQNRQVRASIGRDIVVENGDLVSLQLLPVSILRAAIVVYGYPLAGAVCAAAVAYGLGYADAGAALMALLGIACGYLLARLRLRGERCLREFTPVISEKLAVAACND